MKDIYMFLFSMWVLILLGGGIAVVFLGPASVTGFGEFDPIVSSALKGVTAILLVIVWIVVLHKVKEWIFKRRLAS